MRTIIRSKTDILAQIIGAARDKPVTKTRIAYDCFLSYDLLNECLDVLKTSELLKHDEVNRTYMATGKGLRYLDLCMSLSSYLDMEVKQS
jgi:predicted transcriptional regulator